jgi:hypothetical protein
MYDSVVDSKAKEVGNARRHRGSTKVVKKPKGATKDEESQTAIRAHGPVR